MIENFFNEVMFALTMLLMIPVGFFSLIVMLVALNAEAKRKQREQEAKDREKAAAESAAASVVLSKDDGRVIAQVAPEPQLVMPAAPPPKGEGNTAAKVAKVVAGRAAAAVAKHYLRRWLLGR
ncbi:MAG: hypothetical protein LC104_01615 [Bacteroidales bacterium]|nr:hypothetical protein [Bacteroidales bacterium]